MNITIRAYRPSDYLQLVAIYKQGDLYGGQFDEDRDSAERLDAVMAQSANAILVAEQDNKICGTVSLLKDPRTAWLFRFAANDRNVAKALYDYAAEILKAEGHNQVLVYSPVGNSELDGRYAALGFNKGGAYNSFWKLGL